MFQQNPFIPSPAAAPTAANTPVEKINALKAQIIDLFKKIEELADAHRLCVDWDHFGYGFSGSYRPKIMSYNEAITLIEKGDPMDAETRKRVVAALQEGRDGWESSAATGWVSSSADC